MGGNRLFVALVVFALLCTPGCALKETFNCLDRYCFFPDWTNCNCCDSECYRKDGYNYHWVCRCQDPARHPPAYQ